MLGDISKICANENNIPTNLIGTSEFEEVSPQGCAILKGNNKYEPLPQNWLKRSGVFAPIRRPDFFPSNIIKNNDRSVLNIRDPRDCMVSGYFGFLRLHNGGLKNPENKQKFDQGIDKYVIDDLLPIYKYVYTLYIELIKKHNIPIMYYEDMVTNPTKWLENYYDLAGFNPKNLSKCMEKCMHYFEPVKEEDPNRHKRKVIPGDYREKLRRDTINLLNIELYDILDFFGYEK